MTDVLVAVTHGWGRNASLQMVNVLEGALREVRAKTHRRQSTDASPPPQSCCDPPGDPTQKYLFPKDTANSSSNASKTPKVRFSTPSPNRPTSSRRRTPARGSPLVAMATLSDVTSETRGDRRRENGDGGVVPRPVTPGINAHTRSPRGSRIQTGTRKFSLPTRSPSASHGEDFMLHTQNLSSLFPRTDNTSGADASQGGFPLQGAAAIERAKRTSELEPSPSVATDPVDTAAVNGELARTPAHLHHTETQPVTYAVQRSPGDTPAHMESNAIEAEGPPDFVSTPKGKLEKTHGSGGFNAPKVIGYTMPNDDSGFDSHQSSPRAEERPRDNAGTVCDIEPSTGNDSAIDVMSQTVALHVSQNVSDHGQPLTGSTCMRSVEAQCGAGVTPTQCSTLAESATWQSAQADNDPRHETQHIATQTFDDSRTVDATSSTSIHRDFPHEDTKAVGALERRLRQSNLKLRQTYAQYKLKQQRTHATQAAATSALIPGNHVVF